MVPTAQAQADCIRILADPGATLDEITAARTVAACAGNGTVPPMSHVLVLRDYVAKSLAQNRYGQ
jgi:hypothetical protein